MSNSKSVAWNIKKVRSPLFNLDAQMIDAKGPNVYLKNTNLLEKWSGRWDLNPRPQPWQGCALPLSYARSISGQNGPRRKIADYNQLTCLCKVYVMRQIVSLARWVFMPHLTVEQLFIIG